MHLSFKMYRQFLAAGAASLTAMVSGMCLAWVAQILDHLLGPNSEVPMTAAQSSWMMGALDLGSSVTSLPTGVAVNKFGRKIFILMTGPMYLISWILAAYVRRIEALYVARFIQGLAMGFVYAALPVYMTEISSPEIRGMINNLFANSLYFGLVIEYAISSYLGYVDLILVTAIVPALFTVFFFFQPESPYYLLMKGKREEAAKSLAWLRKKRLEEVNDELEEIADSIEMEMANKTSWTAIFTRPEDRRGVIISQLVGGVYVFCGIYAIQNYSTQIFTETNVTLLSPKWLTIIMGMVMFVSSFFSSAFIDRAGRRPIVILSSIGCGCSLLCISIYLYLDKETDMDLSHLNFVPPFAVFLFCMFYSFGLDPVTTAFRTELFPMDTRGMAAGMCSINFDLGSFTVIKVYQPITYYVGEYFNFFLYSMVCFVGAVLMYFLVIETKGKSLAEVQEILTELCGKGRRKHKKQRHRSSDVE